MTVEDSVSSMAPPALVVRTKGAVRTLWPGRSYQVGRDPAADVPMDDDRVSWRHGVLRSAEDGPQRSGSVQPAMVRRTAVCRKPITTVKVETRRLRIGRSPDNDIVVPDLIVSRHHAELRETRDGQDESVDLGGHNEIGRA